MGFVEDFGMVEDGGVAALGCDDLEPRFVRRSGGHVVIGEEGAGFGGFGVAGEMEHPAGENVCDFDEVGREGVADALHDVHALQDLQPVAGVASEGLIHLGEEGDRSGPGGFAGLDHEVGEEASVFVLLHEGAGAGFYVENQGIERFGELLAHYAGGDEEGRFDGAGVVAEAVEDAVGGDKRGGLADKGGAALAEDLLEAGEGELGVETGDGFELVQRAAGVAEAAAGDHGDADAGDSCDGGMGEARCGEDGADEEGGLVTNSAGGVFVDGEGMERCRVKGLAGVAHGPGEGGEFVGVEAALKDGHQEGRDLGVCGGFVSDRVDEGVDLYVGEGQAVALVKDDVERMDVGHGAHADSGLKAEGSRSARVQVLGLPSGPGKRMITVGAENSAIVWRQAPQGWQAVSLRL